MCWLDGVYASSDRSHCWVLVLGVSKRGLLTTRYRTSNMQSMFEILTRALGGWRPPISRRSGPMTPHLMMGGLYSSISPSATRMLSLTVSSGICPHTDGSLIGTDPIVSHFLQGVLGLYLEGGGETMTHGGDVSSNPICFRKIFLDRLDGILNCGSLCLKTFWN